ncbi:hypothetical protein BV092_00508B, partial [Haemophilus influenzae]
FDWCM